MLRRYQKRFRFRKDNNLFKTIQVNPKIWSDSKTYNSQAPWIEKDSKEYKTLKKQEWSEITFEDLEDALKILVNGNRQ